eukprot:54743_1
MSRSANPNRVDQISFEKITLDRIPRQRYEPPISVEKPERASLFSFYGGVSLSVYMVSGPLLILMNNYVLNDLVFKYPMMLSSFGIFSSAVIVHLLVFLKIVTIREEIRNVVDCKFLLTHIGILGLFQALTLNFGNMVYLYLSVSLIQMLKAFTPVVTMIVAFMTKQDTPNKELIGAISLVSIGTMITTANVSDSDASFIGFAVMFASILAQALKVVLSQKLMQGITVQSKAPKEAIVKQMDTNTRCNKPLLIDTRTHVATKTEVNVKFNVFETLYYYAPTTFICQCWLSLPMEYKDFMQSYDTNMDILIDNWPLFAICGCLGFGVNFGGFLVTKITSGLYLTALSTVRNIVLVFISALLFTEVVTFKQGIGYAISMIGFVYYNYLKINASAK